MVEHVPQVGPLGGPNHAQRLKRVYTQTPAPSGADAVEMSAELRELSRIPGIRLDRVLEVRRQIEAGTYLEEAKLDVALDRAIDDALPPPLAR